MCLFTFLLRTSRVSFHLLSRLLKIRNQGNFSFVEQSVKNYEFGMPNSRQMNGIEVTFITSRMRSGISAFLAAIRKFHEKLFRHECLRIYEPRLCALIICIRSPQLRGQKINLKFPWDLWCDKSFKIVIPLVNRLVEIIYAFIRRMLEVFFAAWLEGGGSR